MSNRPVARTVLTWTGAIAMLFGAAIMLTPMAQANTLRRGSAAAAYGSGYGGMLISGYFDLGPSSDNVLRLENPTAANGNLCAMIYVFNSAEAMGECCGCLLTPNQLRQGSVKSLLGNGWVFSGGTPTHGVIHVVSAMPNNGNLCAANREYVTTPKLNGWITHEQTVVGVTGLTEVPLTDNGSADQIEAPYLFSQCGAILGNGSGAGSCTCPKSDEIFVP